jgi:hypothetical protein
MVRISDIRREPGRLTESEAREELTDFVIFRFERADHGTDYDSEGERVKPTWSNVVTTKVCGISKKEAAKQIKSLHDVHRSLGEKKESLTAAQQRQLEKVLEELEMKEPDHRYHYVLAQIDRKLREKKWMDKSRDRVEVRRGDRTHGERTRRYSENRGRRENVELVDIFGRRRSMVREPKKKVQETVSITAYYKRCPRPEVDAIALLLQQEAQNARQLAPPYPQHTFAAQQMQQNAHANMAMAMGAQMGVQQQQGNKPMVAANPPNMKNGYMISNNKQMGNKPQVQVLPNKSNGNNQARRRASPHPHHRHPRSPTSSHESLYSDSDTYSESDSIITPNSSHSSHSHRKRRRNSSRYIEESAHFGVPPRTLTPHRQRRHEEHRIADELFPPLRRAAPPLAPSTVQQQQQQQQQQVPPAPPPPPPSLAHPPRLSVDLDEIQANAYAAGRVDERVDLRERAAAAAAAEAATLRPAAPRVVHHHYPQTTRRSGETFLLDEELVAGPLLPPSPPMGGGGRVPLRPRVLQHRPSVRLVRPGDVALDEDVIDSLERFRLEEEGMRGRYRDEREERYVDEFYDDVILRSERRRLEEARLRDEEIAFERERMSRPRAFLRRADTEGELFYEREVADPLNPFAPRPGITRRATVGFGGLEYI